MSTAMKKTLWLILAVLVLGGLLGGGACWWRYQRIAAERPPIIEVGMATVLPGVKSGLGTPLTATVTYRCPWGRPPLEAVCTPGPGVKICGEPQIRRSAWGWGNNTWQISVTLRPFHTGKLLGAKLETMFAKADENGVAETKKRSLPDLEITPLPVNDPEQLALASAIEPPKTARRLGIIVAAAVLTAGVILLFWYLRRRASRPVVLTPWQEALQELGGLRRALTAHTLPAEKCFARLTDIVRNYLEKRFSLRAPQQTTEEFLGELNRAESPLDGGQRQFLQSFLTSADLVKFAGIPADGELLTQAIGSAETLVDQTKPQEVKS